MKYLIAVDMEGCACVNGEPFKTLNESRDYQFARTQATREAAAAANALLDGSNEVVIWDNHGGSINLDYDLLPEECLILSGVGKRERMAFADDTYDGALLIGYHAEGGTQDAVLAHTFSSTAFQYMKVNGMIMGEIGIDALLLGEKGIPVIMVSGDDKACAEAKTLLPHAVTAETKKAYGYNISLSKHPKAALRIISEAAITASTNLAEMKPLYYEKPVTLEVRYKRIEGASEAERMGFKRIDTYTCTITFDKLSDYFRG